MNLEITKDKVLKAAGKCPDAKRILETLFPEAFTNPDKSVDIPAKGGIGFFLCIRRGGNLKNKSFYLDEQYDWAILRDSTGQLVLQPTEKG